MATKAISPRMNGSSCCRAARCGALRIPPPILAPDWDDEGRAGHARALIQSKPSERGRAGQGVASEFETS